MAISVADRLAIHELIAMHGHLCDSGELERLAEVFTDDAVLVFDGTAMSRDEAVAAGRELGPANPVGHHVTNVVVSEAADGRVLARSKGLGVRTDGSTGSVVYDDALVRHGEGWRISHRTITVRRIPLQ